METDIHDICVGVTCDKAGASITEEQPAGESSALVEFRVLAPHGEAAIYALPKQFDLCRCILRFTPPNTCRLTFTFLFFHRRRCSLSLTRRIHSFSPPPPPAPSDLTVGAPALIAQPPLQFYLRAIASQPWSDVTIITFARNPAELNPTFAALEMMNRSGLLGPNVAMHKVGPRSCFCVHSRSLGRFMLLCTIKVGWEAYAANILLLLRCFMIPAAASGAPFRCSGWSCLACVDMVEAAKDS